MKGTNNDKKTNADAYDKADARQFGNLHQRMKFLIKEINEIGEENMPASLRWAVLDLETEVKYYKPKDPPFGSKVGYSSPNLPKS